MLDLPEGAAGVHSFLVDKANSNNLVSDKKWVLPFSESGLLERLVEEVTEIVSRKLNRDRQRVVEIVTITGAVFLCYAFTAATSPIALVGIAVVLILLK